MSVQKPDYSYSLVGIPANEVISGAFLAILAKETTSAIGLVVREPDRIVVERFLELGDEAARLKMLTGIVNGTKKYPRQFMFGSFPAEFDEDECQPWIAIKDSKNNPILTVMLEGDFPGRTSAEGFSEAYVVMTEYLGPKLNEVYSMASNNPQKLMDYIKGDSFKKDLSNLFAHRAAFFFMPSVGDPIMLGNFREADKGGSDFPWGTASFNFGHTEVIAAAPAAPKEATMPKNPPKTSKYLDEPVDPQNIPAQEPKPSVPTVVPPKPGDVTEKVAEKIIDGEAVKWTPPSGVRGKGLKKAYRDMLGYLPEDWQQRPSFMIKAKTEATSVSKIEPKKDMKDDAPKPVLPVIDGKQQATAVDFIKKYLGDGSVEIPNPLEVQKQEANIAVFSELCLKTGDLAEINRWPVAGIFAFTKANPEAAALLLIELRRDRINRTQLNKDGDKKLGELTGTEKPEISPAAEPAPLIPSPPPIPEEVPQKRVAGGGMSKYL